MNRFLIEGQSSEGTSTLLLFILVLFSTQSCHYHSPNVLSLMTWVSLDRNLPLQSVSDWVRYWIVAGHNTRSRLLSSQSNDMTSGIPP